MRAFMLISLLLCSVVVATHHEPDVEAARKHAEAAKIEAEEAEKALKPPKKTAFQAVKEAILPTSAEQPHHEVDVDQEELDATHPSILGRVKEGLEGAKERVKEGLEGAKGRAEGAKDRVRVGVEGAKGRVRESLDDVKDSAKHAYETVSTTVGEKTASVSAAYDEALKTLHIRERSILEKAAADFSTSLSNIRNKLSVSSRDPTMSERASRVLSAADETVRGTIGQVVNSFNGAPVTEQARATYEDMLQRSLEKILAVRKDLQQSGLGHVDMQGVIDAVSSRSLGGNVDAVVGGANNIFHKVREAIHL